MTLSSSLPRQLTSEIGRKFAGSVGVPFLKSGRILAVFQAFGKYPSQRHALKIVANLVVKVGDKRFMRKLLIPSGPADHFPLRDLIRCEMVAVSTDILGSECDGALGRTWGGACSLKISL